MTRQTFIHTFLNGDRCTLVIEGEAAGREGYCVRVRACLWNRTPNWPSIVKEYTTWRMESVEQFMRACDGKE